MGEMRAVGEMTAGATTARALKDHRRIAVKIGSALLVDRKAGLRRDWLASLVEDIAVLARGGAELLVVSSGAIALGRTVLGLAARSLPLEESQAAAAVGQIELAGAWAGELARHGLKSGQVLVTLGDTEERRRYLNARATISTLLKLKAVPVINENDTVATSEIRYGDNDRLAARVATMMGADLLVLERNPLEDLANTLSLQWVMKNGRLYDAATLDELWPRQRPLPPLWFHPH